MIMPGVPVDSWVWFNTLGGVSVGVGVCNHTHTHLILHTLTLYARVYDDGLFKFFDGLHNLSQSSVLR